MSAPLSEAQAADGAWLHDVNPPVAHGLTQRRSRPMRWLVRVVATLALAAVAYVGYLVIETSLRTDAPAVPPHAPALERPATAPASIPAWAWDLHRWQLTPPVERGERPAAAPARVPSWYWDWRAWRLSLAPR